MYYWLIGSLSLAHIAVTVWLLSSAVELLEALGHGDIGAALVLVIAGAAVLAGIRLTCATILSALAHAARLLGPAAARRCAAAAIAISPARFRRAVAASVAGAILTGSGFATAAAAAPSPSWPSRTAEADVSAPASPGWPTRSPDAEADAPTSPGWPTRSPDADDDGPTSPNWPTSPAASPTSAPPQSPEDTDADTTPSAKSSPSTDDAPVRQKDSVQQKKPQDEPEEEQRLSDDEPEIITVEAGESLWSIAAEHSDTTDVEQLSARVEAIHEANRSVIGADPNLIMPGQRLEMP